MASPHTSAWSAARASRSIPRHLTGGDAVGRVSVTVCLLILTAGCAAKSRPDVAVSSEVRRDALARARVWHAVPTSSLDIARGPRGKGSFAPNALVDCTYVDRNMGGNTPKFACRLANGDQVKVKYGRDNGEVYAEVAASRLLWALGFSADAMYPVRVRCHGCPGAKPGEASVLFDPATIERGIAGPSLADERGEGWSWPELDAVAPRGARSTRAQRDALKLLAAMLQHTDSKREQQRLICEVKVKADGRCPQPLAYVSDLGKTFGKVNLLNRDLPGSVDLDAWSRTPVWSGSAGCQANAGITMTGTLKDPEISDAGRQLLVRLLGQLSDGQVRDLFRVARFPVRDSEDAARDAATVDRWVAAFHQKRAEIANRRCETTKAAR
jgi:hypothetical protein